MGDGLLALFGLDALQPQLRSAYRQALDVRIGIHFDAAEVGSVQGGGRTQTTAIRDEMNFASQIEVPASSRSTPVDVRCNARAIGRPRAFGRNVVTAIRGRNGDSECITGPIKDDRLAGRNDRVLVVGE